MTTLFLKYTAQRPENVVNEFCTKSTIYIVILFKRQEIEGNTLFIIPISIKCNHQSHIACIRKKCFKVQHRIYTLTFFESIRTSYNQC